MKKSAFTSRQKAVLLLAGFTATVIGFMIKLPSSFRHIDKELHATFYFVAAAFLNLLFAGTNLLRHIVIFASLFVFGMGIEYAQAYSNRFFRSRIHGRFDPEDVAWNVKGLVAFSLLWLLITVAVFMYRKVVQKDNQYASKRG